jgi:hypothetical protein
MNQKHKKKRHPKMSLSIQTSAAIIYESTTLSLSSYLENQTGKRQLMLTLPQEIIVCVQSFPKH